VQVDDQLPELDVVDVDTAFVVLNLFLQSGLVDLIVRQSLYLELSDRQAITEFTDGHRNGLNFRHNQSSMKGGNMKILVTSDLHLSDKIWKHRPIEGDSYHSWRQIVNLAIEHECDVVILAGDLLDKQTNVSNPVQELVAGLRRLEKAHVEVWYNQGQHEYQAVPWMSLDEGTVWLEDTGVTTSNDWNIAGCDYQNADGLMNFLQTTAALQADILVCHQVWLEFMGEECKPQGSFADIPENVRYLITGDYHDNICQKFGQLTVLSPGSTHLRSISEPEDKSVFFMELPDAGHRAKISSWPLATRRRFEIDASKEDDFNVLLEQIEGHLGLAADYADEQNLPEELRKPLMRLIYPQSEVDLCNKLTKLVGDRAHLFFKQIKYVSPDSLEPQLVEHMDAEERVGMLNCLDTYIDKSKQPLTHDLATQLLEAPDPEQALHKWVKEHVK